jgi:hypothetical protein
MNPSNCAASRSFDRRGRARPPRGGRQTAEILGQAVHDRLGMPAGLYTQGKRTGSAAPPAKAHSVPRALGGTSPGRPPSDRRSCARRSPRGARGRCSRAGSSHRAACARSASAGDGVGTAATDIGSVGVRRRCRRSGRWSRGFGLRRRPRAAAGRRSAPAIRPAADGRGCAALGPNPDAACAAGCGAGLGAWLLPGGPLTPLRLRYIIRNIRSVRTAAVGDP